MKIQMLSVAVAVALTMIAGEVQAAKPVIANHPRVNQVNSRVNNQQSRIAQGIKSGSLSASETAHLERGEARINRTIRRDRATDGGHLTKGEQAHINKMENRESARIAADKHN